MLVSLPLYAPSGRGAWVTRDWERTRADETARGRWSGAEGRLRTRSKRAAGSVSQAVLLEDRQTQEPSRPNFLDEVCLAGNCLAPIIRITLATHRYSSCPFRIIVGRALGRTLNILFSWRRFKGCALTSSVSLSRLSSLLQLSQCHTILCGVSAIT